MTPQEFEQLHEEYLRALAEYHNLYIKYIKGRQARAHIPPMRNALKEMIRLSKELKISVGKVQKDKKEKYKDGYQYQRTNKRDPRVPKKNT